MFLNRLNLKYKLIFFLLPVSCLFATEPLQEQILFARGQDGYNTFRIPALYETSSGVLLAFAEGRVNSSSDTGNIDIVLKRSLNGGQTWLPIQIVWGDGNNTCGNPTVLQDPANDRIWLFCTHNLGQDSQTEISNGTSDGVRTIWSCYSDDEGASWSMPINHYPKIGPFNPPNGWDATGPGRGIVLKHGPNSGRLVIPAIQRNIYSDDHGVTWHESTFLPSGTSESQIVELTNGTLVRNDRNVSHKSTNRRLFCCSYDQGASWGPIIIADELITPICQASTIALSSHEGVGGQFYVFSNPSALTRIKMTVQYSYDNCVTWPIDKLIHTGPSGYSCLTGIGKDHVGLLYEGGTSKYYDTIRFAKFTREWIKRSTVFRWDFDEFSEPQTLTAGSSVKDSLGYGYDGQLLAPLPVISTMIKSEPKMAVSFDGTDGQGIVLGDSQSKNMLDLAPDEPMAITVTFRTQNHNDGGSSNSGALISKDVGPNTPSWWMRVQDGLVRFFLEDGTNAISLWSTSAVADNQWHQVRIVRDPSQGQAQLYLDGSLQDTKADNISGSVANSNDVVVGKFNGASRNFNGDIASVQIFKSPAYIDECGDRGYNQMDFNKDCHVNIIDFAFFAEQWLTSTNPEMQ
ncbi:MAG: exo-alpha-sialidase [Phycisphaerae bacterium]|nr:exo-alpha-sialidase [Phycisphaerae bacterium]